MSKSLPSQLRNLILAQLPLSELQRLADDTYSLLEDGTIHVGVGGSILFHMDNCRQILQLRYQLTSDQLRQWYDPFTMLRPIETLTKIAAYYGDVGYRQHWHIPIIACLILAIRNQNVTLLRYYISHVDRATPGMVQVPILLREAIKTGNVELLRVWLDSGLAMREDSIIGLPLSREMLPLLLRHYNNDAIIGYLHSYFDLTAAEVAPYRLLQPINSTIVLFHHMAILLGGWYRGLRQRSALLQLLQAIIPDITVNDSESAWAEMVNWLLNAVDLEILPTLATQELTPLQLLQDTAIYSDNCNCYPVITRAMISRCPEMMQQVEQYVATGRERTGLLKYLRLLQGEPFEQDGSQNDDDSYNFSDLYLSELVDCIESTPIKSPSSAIRHRAELNSLYYSEVIYQARHINKWSRRRPAAVFLNNCTNAADGSKIEHLGTWMGLTATFLQLKPPHCLAPDFTELSYVKQVLPKYDRLLHLIDPLYQVNLSQHNLEANTVIFADCGKNNVARLLLWLKVFLRKPARLQFLLTRWWPSQT